MEIINFRDFFENLHFINFVFEIRGWIRRPISDHSLLYHKLADFAMGYRFICCVQAEVLYSGEREKLC